MSILLKEQLYNLCVEFIKNKEETIIQTIKSNQKALTSETKSSAGDKHETGRAMLQLEMEKASQQLKVVNTMNTVLQRLVISKTSDVAILGSLIITTNNNYFLSISAGELKLYNETYYAVSTSSPIGKLLLGKRVGETLTFNKQFEILQIL